MKYLLLAALLLPTSLNAQASDFTPDQRIEGEAQVATAGRLLADHLRNPASARFRNVFLFKTVGRDGKEYVSLCGEVNAENGFGGMTGFQNFTIVGNTLLTGSSGVLNADMVCNGTTPRVHDTRDYSSELRKAFDANAGQ